VARDTPVGHAEAIVYYLPQLHGDCAFFTAAFSLNAAPFLEEVLFDRGVQQQKENARARGK
jgi:hypothetical protein